MHMLAMMVGSKSFVLTEKQINPDGPVYVKLQGRKAGLVDWLLTLIGINTTTTMEIYSDRIEYHYGSLSGRTTELIPLSKVSNLVCGYFKPIVFLGLAVICLVAAFATYGLALLPAAIFAFLYFFWKSTYISIIPSSGSVTSVAFKRSVIERKNLDENEAMQVIQIVSGLVEEANRRTAR